MSKNNHESSVPSDRLYVGKIHIIKNILFNKENKLTLLDVIKGNVGIKLSAVNEAVSMMDELLGMLSEDAKKVSGFKENYSHLLEEFKNLKDKCKTELGVQKQKNKDLKETIAALEVTVKDLTEEKKSLKIESAKKYNNNRSLSCEVVREIKEALKVKGVKITDIAEKFNTNKSKISRIKKGQLYKDC